MRRIAVSILVLPAVVLVLGWALPASAASHVQHQKHATLAPADVPATTETLGSSGAWSAYVSRDKTGRVCYLAGHPQKSEPAGAARQQPMAMVTHRPAENISNVVSFVEGYTLKSGSNVTVDVGGKKFDLFTQGDSAWAATSELDRTIVATLDKAGSAVVKAEPEKGRGTVDVYSLAGFSRALALIDKACGVTRAGIAPPAHPHAHPHHPARRIVHKRAPPQHK